MSSKDAILKLGVVTPYVRFQMVGGVIESGKPSYFISLENTRTCRKACSFKLTLAYVPDTFRYSKLYSGCHDAMHRIGCYPCCYCSLYR